MSDTPSFDVVVLGAGPAGSTSAALLARAGLRVCVVERERFPRFHIGESLLPACLPVLERIGVDLHARGYLRKEGAEFYDEPVGEFQEYPFADALPGPPRYAFQVERAQFDHDLAQAAVDAGAEVRFGTTALNVAYDAAGVELTLSPTPQGIGPDEGDAATRPMPSAADGASAIRGRYVVDASGRTGLVRGRVRDVVKIAGLGRAAAFVHVENLSESVFAELSERGNVKVLRVPQGWIWVIPLAGGKLSVGLVLREGRLDQEAFDRHLHASPLLSKMVSGATVGPLRRIGDYSYMDPKPYGPRYVAVGDAAGFIDPVFSSGVALSVMSADRMADRLIPAMAAGTEAEPGLMAPLSRTMAVAYRTFYVLAHRFYHTQIVDNVFFARDPHLELRSGLISLLAGDVWRDDNRFAQLVLGPGRYDAGVVPWADRPAAT